MAVGQLVPRYGLWLRLHELGWDPATLSSESLLSFCDHHLASFLGEHDLALCERKRRSLRKRLRRFDPRYPSPEETMVRLFAPNT